ncbi:cell division protein ZipA [Gallibacterium trehalosifermentans]|uniref:Cell division protein ZipA n=1 Tax=Gallibacterium trehalosifermentans TaxID=516935 RepID=A0ABV6H2X6_9PAST
MDLQQILILLGVLALGILIGHGIWSSRREKAQFEKSAQQFERHKRSTSTSQFSPQGSSYSSQQSGILPQSIDNSLSSQHEDSPVNITGEIVQSERSVEQDIPYQASLPLEEDITEPSVERQVENIKITLPNSQNGIETDNKSMPNNVVEQQRDSDMLFVDSEDRATETVAQEVKTEQNLAVNNTVEPKETVSYNQQKPEFIMLYVVAPENRQFYGTHIHAVLEELGFIFGEYNIYHRHLDVNMVNSPVIFSVANMIQPGTFDPSNFDNFSTVGLTLFMRLPSPGNDIVNFRMLCCAAETLAEKLNGFVLNGHREIFTDESRDEYLELLRS